MKEYSDFSYAALQRIRQGKIRHRRYTTPTIKEKESGVHQIIKPGEKLTYEDKVSKTLNIFLDIFDGTPPGSTSYELKRHANQLEACMLEKYRDIALNESKKTFGDELHKIIQAIIQPIKGSNCYAFKALYEVFDTDPQKFSDELPSQLSVNDIDKLQNILNDSFAKLSEETMPIVKKQLTAKFRTNSTALEEIAALLTYIESLGTSEHEILITLLRSAQQEISVQQTEESEESAAE